MAWFDSRNVDARNRKRLFRYCNAGNLASPTECAREWWEEDGRSLPESFNVKPAPFVVCPTCQGYGKHVNPAIDSHGLTSEDFDNDPDFADAYWSGGYDVVCGGCDGDRVVRSAVGECDHPLWQEWVSWVESMCADDPWDAAEARYFGY
jgi:hypothetical protein